MAKLERVVQGDFLALKEYIKRELPQKSMTFTLEEEFEGTANGKHYWVAACERYAYSGGNRTSLCITLIETEDGNHIMATGTGGSQALFMKINTWGESAFLDTLEEVLEAYENVK